MWIRHACNSIIRILLVVEEYIGDLIVSRFCIYLGIRTNAQGANARIIFIRTLWDLHNTACSLLNLLHGSPLLADNDADLLIGYLNLHYDRACKARGIHGPDIRTLHETQAPRKALSSHCTDTTHRHLRLSSLSCECIYNAPATLLYLHNFFNSPLEICNLTSVQVAAWDASNVRASSAS